jgi:hypothetical protein
MKSRARLVALRGGDRPQMCAHKKLRHVAPFRRMQGVIFRGADKEVAVVFILILLERWWIYVKMSAAVFGCETD